MVSSTLINNRHQPYPVLACKSRMLIVSDSAERLTRLRVSLFVGEVEIAGASSPGEMCSACRGAPGRIASAISSHAVQSN